MMLGPHVIRSSDAARQWAQRAGIVKGLDNVGILQSAPASAVRVFRHYFADQGAESPESVATAIISALGGYRHPNLYVEALNEIHLTKLYLQIVTNLLHAAGLKVAGGSYGTGDYNSTDIAIVQAAGCDALALHAYWGNQGFSPWHALRYRSYGTTLPILITECGRDKIEGGKGGWRLDGISDKDYVAELLAYDHEISKDSGVLGACVFSAGPTPDWENFNTDGLVPLLLIEIPPLKESTNVPNIGQGIKRAEQYLGPFLEDQTYDAAGTDHEVAKAANVNGWATWTKKTNETVVYKVTGEMWRDYGNHGDGSLKVLAPPFK